MQHITNPLLISSLLAASLSAQAGPGMFDADPATAGHQTMTQSAYFTSISGLPGTPTMADITPAIFGGTSSITQVSTGKTGMAGLAAGEFHMCLTISNLSTNYGRQGSGDVILGKVSWNTGSPVFTPTSNAANMNSTGNDFGLMIDGKDGTRAAIDWPAGPQWSKRASNTVAFPKPVLLTGTTRKYVDPCPGNMNGVLGCFWVSSSTTISWSPVLETYSGTTLTAAALDIANTVVVISSFNQPHSPTPVFTSNGDALGMWFSRVSGGDSDQYFTGQLPDLLGGLKVHDTTSWSNNGGIAGSRFLCAYSGHYSALLEGRGSYLVGSTDIAVGASSALHLTIGSPVGNPPLFTSQLGLSLGVSPSPIQLTGVIGELGLDLAKFIMLFGGPSSINQDETATMVLPATDSSLKGITLHFQALSRAIVGFNPALSNTLSSSFK